MATVLGIQNSTLLKQFAAILFAIVSFIVALAWNSFFTKWLGSEQKSHWFLLGYSIVATIAGVLLVAMVYSWVD